MSIWIIDRREIYKYEEDSDEYAPLTDHKFFGSYFDTIMTQYRLGLAEFETDNYESNNLRQLLWIYFFLATMLTQVIFFNILIAVISDSYAHIMESKSRNSLIQRTKIYADFIRLIPVNKEIDNNQYLFQIKPIYTEESAENWDGSLNLLKRQIKHLQNETKGLV